MHELKSASTIRPENYRFLQEHIKKSSGIVLDETKHYLVEARLLPIVLAEGLRNLDDLCAKLRQAPLVLQRRVIEAMTTNETYFFREPAHFEALRNTILPNLFTARKATRRLSIWSAAASTGQEAFSLAMLISELGLENWEVRIVGTDLAEGVLERAREAKYSQVEVDRGLPSIMLAKYFTKTGSQWELKLGIKRMVSFQAMDLRRVDRSIGIFDVIMCRNVLIYFDVETKLRIIEQLRSALRSDGYLFLGASETGLLVGSNFSRVCTNEATYFRGVDKSVSR